MRKLSFEILIAKVIYSAVKDLESDAAAFRKEHTDAWADKWLQGDILLEGE